MAGEYLPVSWNQYHALAQKLAGQIIAGGKSFDVIVAIARGGLSVGLILSDYLKTSIASITIQSYTDIQKQGELVITSKLGMQIGGKDILLVDDVADSGKTFRRGTSYLKRLRPNSITTAAIFYKPHSVFRPDFFAKQTSAWILLPHEVTEWIITFTRDMKREGKSTDEIHAFLMNLGYTNDQIVFVLTSLDRHRASNR